MRQEKLKQLKFTYGHKNQCRIENMKSNCIFRLNTDILDAYYIAFLPFLSGGVKWRLVNWKYCDVYYVVGYVKRWLWISYHTG